MDRTTEIRGSQAEKWQSRRGDMSFSNYLGYPLKVDSGGGLPTKLEGTEEILFALALAVEQRDRQTAGHCERLALIAVSVGLAMNLDQEELLVLYRGGYLHDIGKVGIPDAILFKTGKLNEDEWELMRTHTTRGEEICRPLSSLSPVLPVIRHHHERWDGTGYPDGLKGEQIPLVARILQIADIYDALTSVRPYKQAIESTKACEIIQQETARGWRDPHVVATFLKLHQDVIPKIVSYTKSADHSLRAMHDSISGLQHFIGYSMA